MNVRSTPFNATGRKRRASLEISLLVVLASLGCAGNRSVDPDAQPAARRAVDRDAAEAAVALRDYFDSISNRDYARAYDYWQPDRSVTSGRTFEEFQRSLANVTAANAEIGEPRVRNDLVGAQNLIFPVKVRFTHTDGSQECLDGTYSMTRPVVPGARWSIASSDLNEC